MHLPLIYHPGYSIRWPPDHRFPMSKFQALYELLIADGIADPTDFYMPKPATMAHLAQVHERDYLKQFFAGTLDPKMIRATGLSWSEHLVRRSRLEVGGTILAAKLALKYGLACQTAGGTHHAFPDRGAGFCALNDLAVAARWALTQTAVQKILILDLDVHQGDGTAFIFADEPAVFTCSFHCAKNFPARKQQSDLDIGLARGVGDEAYLEKLGDILPRLIEVVQPDLVFYDAGVDVHQDDRLGHLALTDEGIYQRDHLVISTLRAQGIPLACVIGGGYAACNRLLAYRHSQVHRAAKRVWTTGKSAPS